MINKKSVTRLLSRILSFTLVFLMYVSIFPVPVSAKAANESSDRVIVALGDSFSSGEGIEPFYDQDLPIEQKLKSQDWLAHRSEKAWSGLLNLNDDDKGICYLMNMSRYDKNQPEDETHWYFAASSGAETINLYSEQKQKYHLKANGKTYKKSESITKQLAIFETVKANNQKADYVTLTLGGNDVGFTEVIESVSKTSFYVTPYSSTQILRDKLTMLDMATVKSLETAYRKIHEVAGSQAAIIVAGYPHLFESTVNTHSSYPTGLLVSLHERLAINNCVDILNSRIKSIVEKLQKENIDIHYVSVVKEFLGHGAYSLYPYINPIYISPKEQDLKQIGDFPNPSSYSMHPNENGAKAYARCVQTKIDELEKRDSSDNSSPIVPIETTKPSTTRPNSNTILTTSPGLLPNQKDFPSTGNWQDAAVDLICNAPDYGLSIDDVSMSVELIDATGDNIPEIFFGTYMGRYLIPTITGYFYYDGSKYVKGAMSEHQGTYPIEPHTNSNGQPILLTTTKGDNDFSSAIPEYSSYWYTGIFVYQLNCSGSTANFKEVANFSEYRNDINGFYSEDANEIQWAQTRWEEFRQEAMNFNTSHPIEMYYNYVVCEPVSLDICSSEGYKSAFTSSFAQSVVDQYANYY